MDLLEELVAERDIRKTLALYAQYTDDLDAEGWVNMFTEDGVMVSGPKRMHGHAELRAWIAKVHSGPKLRHMMANAAITIDSPTTAHVEVDMGLLRAEGSRWALVSSPRYSDKLVKTAAGWKFLERILHHRAP
ncbi:MAG: nuclear transport factor 2 family protein [Spongiibacteraceae bacterium]